MKNIDFNPFGTASVIIRFNCKECGEKVISDEISVPEPDYSSETAHDSYNDNDGSAVCDCGEQYNISVWSSYAGGYVEIEELDESDDTVEIEEINEEVDEDIKQYYEEQYEIIKSNTGFFDTFKREIENIKTLNNSTVSDSGVDKTLRKQLFVSVITIMETYLSDAFINTTLSKDDYLKTFVKTFKDFDGDSIRLRDYFDYSVKIKEISKKGMLDVIYHNIPKVSGMYKDTLEINFPDLKEIMKAVSMRHDIVHRNGKTKEEKELIIDKSLISKTLTNVENFILEIDKQIKTK